MNLTIRLLIATTLLLGSGCAKQDWIDRTLVTVDVTGTWEGTAGGGGLGSRDLLLELEQQGATIKGFWRFVGQSRAMAAVRMTSGAIEGTVAGDVFRFRQPGSDLAGELTVSGDEMTGRISLVNPVPVYLRRVEPSSPPTSPPR